jgi:N-acetylglucosaminyldiphosphoundecaprenol N-acetyl-beta-D-mannosaminyltransferase
MQEVLTVSATPEKIDVLGVGVSATSYNTVVATCAEWIRERSPEQGTAGRYICVTSVHGIMEARNDSDFRAILNRADIVTPDGMPLVWALRSFGAKNQERVYGPDLMLHLCANAEIRAHRVFLYGGRPDTLDTLCDNLQKRFPNLILVGRYSPPFRPSTDEEDHEICRLILATAPDVIFVGISTPKQELWMARHSRSFPGVAMIGVGAAFDFHAGRVRQAPEWMQSRGLEWLFRLAQEPARLWKRYVLITPWFLPCWGMQKLSLMMRNAACGYAKK